jgi:protein-tyrosine phosphatase
MGFADLHSHVLPALDDGVPAMRESMELVRVLEQMGFDVVCATPHQREGFFMPTREAIDAAYAEVRSGLAARGSALDLRLGAENFWDETFRKRAQNGEQPAYTGGKAFLFELDTRVAPPNLDDLLFKIRLGGLLPVMAHPERYAPFWDTDRYQTLARSAALLVDLGALDGAHGKRECTQARRLVEQGLAHGAASDVHSVADARSAGAGIAWIKKRLGAPAVERLLAENPRRILQGELPD